MGNEELTSHESSEGAPSFEDFVKKVNETVALMRKLEQLSPYNPDHGIRRGGPIRKQRDYIDTPDYYVADLGEVADLPEFKDLIDEEQEILSNGPSNQEVVKYSTIAERAYRRKLEITEDIEKKLNAMVSAAGWDNPDWHVYKTADILFKASMGGKRPVDTPLEESLLRDKFALLSGDLQMSAERKKEDKEDALLQKQFGERFRASKKNAGEALRGQKMSAELTVMGEMAQTRGFPGSKEMWEHDLDEMSKLKDEIGEEKFRRLEDMNRSR